MIASLVLLAALLGETVPHEVTVSGSRGDTRVPVSLDASGAPALPAARLLAALSGTVRLDSGWAEVTVAQQPFRFLVGAPLYVFSRQLLPLASGASLSGDSLFLP
jgi:hypothetical protein